MIIIVVIGAFATIIVVIMTMIVGMPVMMINVIKCTITLTLDGLAEHHLSFQLSRT